MAEKHELAYVVLDLDGVHLYRHGDPEPEHIPLDKLYRVIVSLRDVAGPCVWLEQAPDRVGNKPEGTESRAQRVE